MKALLRNRWFLGAVAVSALALIIWFIGELIAIGQWRPLESTTARFVLILLVLAGWLGLEAARILAARRANARLLDGIAGGDEAGSGADSRSAQELAVLRTRLQQAIETLKKAKFGEGKGGEQRYLYQLPWYVFIGAPGSGKTTALINSGLRFPLAEAGAVNAVKGVGGTRNCDWWFTDEAVLLDTAGRYTTQESEREVDSAAWLGFLDLLKRQRPRSPLNGAIITVSVSDLLGQSESERARYAASVRARVQELYGKLGVSFPLYVLVTKVDLLAGFTEFYSDLGGEERAQVWGATFALPARGETADPAAAWVKESALLEQRLNARLLARLAEERDLQRRALLYNFPQQFSALQPLLKSFLEQAFGSTRFQQQPMLRGVYFSSGTQEGTPIDRVLGTLSRALNLERKVLAPSRASGKSYFLTRLLRDVVFQEAGLVGADERREKKLALLAKGAYAGLGALALLALLAWGTSYLGNAALIAEAQRKAEEAAQLVAKVPQPTPEDWDAVLPVLNALRDLPYGAAAQGDARPWSLGFGLFTGNKLGAQALKAYERSLRDVLLPRVALALEAQVGRTLNEPEKLYEWFKGYLMLYTDRHLDPKYLEEVMRVVWGRTYSRETGTQQLNDLAGHLRAALAVRPVEMTLPRDTALIDEARKRLAALPLADRIYARLRIEGLNTGGAPFRISEAAGPAAAQVFVRASKAPLTQGVPFFFTAEGFRKAFKGGIDALIKDFQAEEAWVLGEQFQTARGGGATGQLLDQVRRKYLDEYMRVWDEFFKDIRLAPTTSLLQVVEIAKVLSAPDSPLKRLVVAAAREVTLAPETPAGGAVEKAAGAVVDTARKALGAIVGEAVRDRVADATRRPEAVVDAQFAGVRNVAAGAPGQKAPIDLITDAVAEFYTQLVAYQSSRAQGGTAMQIGPAAAKLRADAGRAPAPVSTVLLELAARAEGNVVQEVRKEIAGGAAGAAPTCRAAIPNRYPFARDSQQDVPLADFARVFGPTGEIASFFTAKLQPEIDMSGAVWRPRQGSPVPAEIIPPFQRAAAIREAFFGGGPQVGASADLVLLSADAGVSEVVLEVDGQSLRFSTAKKELARLQWPGPKSGLGAKLQVVPGGPGLSFDGSWALFRLLDRARIETAGGPDRLRLAFQVDGKGVTFELRAASVRNPFALRDLQGFRCPG
jgi:type VI secretion system protein ImpL